MLSATALSGCMLAGDDYARPELELNQSYAVIVPAVESQSIANVKWFDLYGDPQLAQYVEEALQHNLDLQLAVARVDEARGRLRISRSALLPTIDGSISTSASPQGNSNDSTFTAGIVVGWEIDLFGKLRRQNEAQRAQLLATEAGRNAVISSLVTQVATTWFTICELREEEAIIRQNIVIQEDALKLVELLHRQGVVSDAEEQQAIGLLNSTRAALPLVVRSRLVTENTLAVLMGRYPTEVPDAAPRNAAGLKLTSLPLGVPSDLLARRPDVIAAEHRLHAATAVKGVAIANRFPFPTIGLDAIFGRSSTTLDGLLDASKSVNIYSWGPSLLLPILNFGRDAGNVDVADAQLRQALIGYRQAIQNAMFDVQQAGYSLNAVDGQLGPLNIQVAATRRSLDLQQRRFKAGVSSYLEVLDAQRQLLATELGVARAKLDRDVALLDLYRSLGGGWTPDPSTDESEERG
jgi:multidrug efflux system outer membrane protein